MAASRLYCPPEEFTVRLRQRLPMNIGFTFTKDQLDALRRAFGDRFHRRHAIDMRGTIHLPWGGYYIVFQIGRDRRTDERSKFVSNRTRTVLDTALCALSLAGVISGLALVGLHFLQ